MQLDRCWHTAIDASKEVTSFPDLKRPHFELTG
jgi:hypothetical protein